MGFLIRFILIVGLIYVLSPMHPGMPDWIEKSAEAVSIVNSTTKSAQQFQSFEQTITSACEIHPEACTKVAEIKNSISKPKYDLSHLMEGLPEKKSKNFQPVVEISNEPESTASIAAIVPLPPRRTVDMPINKKI